LIDGPLAQALGIAGNVLGALILVLAGLLGCASIVHGPDRPPSAQEITGTYDWGHRGSSETWELRADGTFTRTLHPHFSGEASVEFTGTWALAGNVLHLAETPRPNGNAETMVAEAFFHEHKPAFARAQDIEAERVHEWWVYERRDGS
jgi:hypothetical protein